MGLRSSALFLLIIAAAPCAFAQQDDIAALIQNSVVKACDQINKKKTSCTGGTAISPAPPPVAVTTKADLKRCDPARRDTPENTPLANSQGQEMALSRLSPDEAWELFQYVSSQKHRYGLNGNYVADRVCAQRAQLVAYDLLQDCHVKSAKIFVQPSRSWMTLGLGRNMLSVKSQGRTYRWDNFHVANVVMVNEAGEDAPYVIDPLLFSRPVPLATWEKLVKQNDSGASSTLTGPGVYLLGDASDDGPDLRPTPGRALQDLEEARRLARQLRH